jgi:predicted TPR repeat methyltransferase
MGRGTVLRIGMCPIGARGIAGVRAAAPLRPGGLFAFFVEANDGPDYAPLPSRRYAHGEEYARARPRGPGRR